MKTSLTDNLLENDFGTGQALKSIEATDNNKVIVYIWKPSEARPLGHSAIEIIVNHEREYISVAGSETAVENGSAYECITNLCLYMKMPAELYPISELKIYRNYKKTTLRNLDLQRMLDHAKQLKQEINDSLYLTDNETGEGGEAKSINQQIPRYQPNKYYGLSCCNKTSVCSEISFEILETGGIRKLIPYYANFLDPRHMIFLALRPPLAIAALAPLFYSFLLLQSDKPYRPNLWPALALFGQLTSVLLLDKFVIPRGWIPWLSPTFARSRKLIEVCIYDFCVQLACLLGFGLGGMYFRYALTDDPENTQFLDKFGEDFLLWLMYSVGGFFVGGYTASLLYLPAGLRLYLTPVGLGRLVDYLEDTKSLNPRLRYYYFLKEFGLLCLVTTSALFSYISRRYFIESDKGFFIGVPISVLAGYGLTKLYNVALKWLLDPTDEMQKLKCNQQALLISHDAKPEQFGLICLGTTMGTLGSIMLIRLFCTDDIIINSLASIGGAMIGYIIGASIHQACASIKTCLNDVGLFKQKLSPTPTDYAGLQILHQQNVL